VQHSQAKLESEVRAVARWGTWHHIFKMVSMT